MNRTIRCTVAAVALLLPAATLEATSVRTVNLEEMVGYADRVFYGRCLGVAEAEGRAGFAVMEYTFEVVEGIKGVASGEVVKVRQVTAGKMGRLGVPGMPSYREGQKLLLFLHGDSQLGLTSPVGFTQGVFRMIQDRDGLKAVNGVGNSNLTYELAPDRISKMGLSKTQIQELSKAEPIRFATLASAVRQIERSRVEEGKSIR